METGKRVAIYTRLDHDRQSDDQLLDPLRVEARRSRATVVGEYSDTASSGVYSRYYRPGFNALLAAVARKEIDLVVCRTVADLGRSVDDLMVVLGDLRAAGVDLYLHEQKFDSSTPRGSAMLEFVDVCAGFRHAAGTA